MQAITLGVILIIIFFIRKIYFTKSCRIDDAAKTSYPLNFRSSHISVFKDENSIRCVNLKQFMDIACELVRSFSFILRILALSTFFFLTSGLQFWITNYLINVTKVKKFYVYCYFSSTLLTAPLFGVFLGYVITNSFNNFKGKFSIIFILILSIILSFLCYTINLDKIRNSFLYFGINLWLIIFFSFIQIQNFISLILFNYENKAAKDDNDENEALKEDNMQTISFIMNFSSNLFGYFPGPLIYGVLLNEYVESDPLWTFTLFVYYSFISFLLVFIVVILRIFESDNLNIPRKTEVSQQDNKLTNLIISKGNSTKNLKVYYISPGRICGIGSFVLGNYVSQFHLDQEISKNVDEDKISVVSCETDMRKDIYKNIEFNESMPGNSPIQNRREIFPQETPNFGNNIGQFSQSPESLKFQLGDEYMGLEHQHSLFGPKKLDIKNEEIN